MADIIPFDFETHAVRIVMRDGAPWFVASDEHRELDDKRAYYRGLSEAHQQRAARSVEVLRVFLDLCLSGARGADSYRRMTELAQENAWEPIRRHARCTARWHGSFPAPAPATRRPRDGQSRNRPRHSGCQGIQP